MRRRLTLSRRAALAVAFAALGAALAPAGSAAAVDARIQGVFTMKGTITRADNVRGEHAGQHVTRSWRFNSKCASGPCGNVVLHRTRSAHHVDRLVLGRTGPGSYTGKGRFFFPLRCAGRVDKHGGEARVKITVHITSATNVDGQPFASRVKASYSNPRRINHTECGGSLGRDGARYTGTVDKLPGPPSAKFAWSQPAPPSTTVSFADHSARGSGGAPIASRSWDFGDPGSGANSASGRNPTHNFSGHGTFTVKLTIVDANGLTSTVSHQVTV
jgi:PKD domain